MKKCKNILVSFEKEQGHHSQLFENHEDIINLRILHIASTDWHKSYMPSLELAWKLSCSQMTS